MSSPIRKIVVAGGGITAWSAAAALKRRLAHIAVTVIATPPPVQAMAEQLSSTLPSILDFHADLHLSDADVILRANSSLRMGTLFEGWRHDGGSYVHAYGEYGTPLGSAAFHQHWLRAALTDTPAPFDCFSPAAVIGRAGRIVPPEAAHTPPLTACTHGLEIDPNRYRQMMRAYALHLGVEEIPGRVANVLLHIESGFIDHVQVENGETAAGDLFVDCTGPAAVLRSTMGGTYESWENWLPCDRVILGEAPPVSDPSPLTTATAHGAGWTWEAQSMVRTSLGFVYASRHLSDEHAARLLESRPGARLGEPMTLHQGRWTEAWRGNCVAVGEAGIAVEPLEWTNLHLAHSAIDRIISMMPGSDCAPVELAEFNRQSAAEADRVRDFLALHYVTCGREEPFWREAAAVEPPPQLAHTLSLFRERGRLPFYEEETFTRDSWVAVMLGQDVRPRRVDPLVESVPPEQAQLALSRMREAVDALARRLPTQRAYFNSITRQAAP